MTGVTTLVTRPAVLGLAFGLGLSACASQVRHRTMWVDARQELLIERAAFDLVCPKDQLRPQELGNDHTKGVEGCGRRAVYLWDYGHDAWLMNGAVDRSGPAADPAAAMDSTNPTSSATREDKSGSPGGTTTP